MFGQFGGKAALRIFSHNVWTIRAGSGIEEFFPLLSENMPTIILEDLFPLSSGNLGGKWL